MRRCARPAAAVEAARQEDGIALILSVIVMGVLTIATAAIVTAITSNEHAFGRDRQANRALNIAEAGLNAGVAAGEGVARDRHVAVPDASGTIDQRHVVVHRDARAGRDQSRTCTSGRSTSTGVSPDGNVTRIVSTKVRQTITHHSTSTTTTTPVSPVYGYGFFLGDPASDCVTLGGGNTFAGNGDLERECLRQRVALHPGQRRHARADGHARARSPSTSARSSATRATPRRSGPRPRRSAQATVVGGCIDKSNSRGHVQLVGELAHLRQHLLLDAERPAEADDRHRAGTRTAKPGPTTGCNDDPTDPANPAHMSSYPSGLRPRPRSRTPSSTTTRRETRASARSTSCAFGKLRLPLLRLGRNPRRPARLDHRAAPAR